MSQEEIKESPPEGPPEGDPSAIPVESAVSEGAADAAAGAVDSDGQGEIVNPLRRRRDPFRDLKVSSKDAALKSKELASRSEIKRIKKAGVRHEGRKVVTTDVKMLKSLSIDERLAPGEYINYYIEPVRIEYYIPRESRFVSETRHLYVPLVDPTPRTEPDDAILRRYMDEDRFLDIIEIMNEYPQYITSILESYNVTMNLYESMSRAISEAMAGTHEGFRTAFYLTEVLSEYEPTLAALEFLGDFHAWNMNWLVRRLNEVNMEFYASDKTVSYFIKLRNQYWQDKDLPYDERFEILAALFYEQAFPHRGTVEGAEDFYSEIFESKSIF
ncbi:MAG: hypothetical protein HY042_07650 [Spirochaetia bacterium]|nr:hypothetical protein [Spirochaetia bacterium]